MSVLDEVAGKLVADGLCSSTGLNGWTLIKSILPDTTAGPHKVVALIESGGMAPALPVELDYPTWQVIVRGDVTASSSRSYAVARAQAESIKLALHGLGATYLPTSSSTAAHYYVQVAAQQEPTFLRFDEAQRPLITCNFAAIRSRT